MLKKAGIIHLVKKEKILKTGLYVMEWLQAKSVEIYLLKEVHEYLSGDNYKYCSIKKMAEECDIILSIGGDGTLLALAQILSDFSVPVIGINLGRFGFMTTIELELLNEGLHKLYEGDYLIENRIMLHARGFETGREVLSENFLNDIHVYDQQEPFKLRAFRVWVNDKWVDDFNCNGILISTPTGSTGFALSLGGPLIYPKTECFLLMPVLSHSMKKAQFILPLSSSVKIEAVDKKGSISLSVDGSSLRSFGIDSFLSVDFRNKFFKRIAFSDKDYFDFIREKF